MKQFFLIIYMGLMLAHTYAQDPMQDIKERVWELNELYVDSTLQQDTLYLFFSNDDKLISDKEPSKLTTYQNVRTISGLQGAYQYQAPGTANPEQLRVDDSGEIRNFQIIHRDINNLILMTYDTIPGENLTNEQDYIYPIEYRLIPFN